MVPQMKRNSRSIADAFIRVIAVHSIQRVENPVNKISYAFYLSEKIVKI
jgi:hypothetical protein